MNPISSGGIALRFLFALLLVLFSYNPSGYSYAHWLVNTIAEPTPWLALGGIVLLIAWVIYIRATLRSLGPIGLSLAAVFIGVVIWALVDLGLISLDNTSAFVWLLEFFIAGVLTIGMSWSHIRRRMSGQSDVDDVDA
jgi:hypothetical protein